VIPLLNGILIGWAAANIRYGLLPKLIFVVAIAVVAIAMVNAFTYHNLECDP